MIVTSHLWKIGMVFIVGSLPIIAESGDPVLSPRSEAHKELALVLEKQCGLRPGEYSLRSFLDAVLAKNQVSFGFATVGSAIVPGTETGVGTTPAKTASKVVTLTLASTATIREVLTALGAKTGLKVDLAEAPKAHLAITLRESMSNLQVVVKRSTEAK